LDNVGWGGNRELIVTVIIRIMLATDGKECKALNNDLLNSDINLRSRQPQQHCAKKINEKVLVEAF
jgi:hypothetical protein